MKDRIVNIDNLEEMLRKFFDGETSCAEERALEQLFSGGCDIPSEYECYRDMFKWYAGGMDAEKQPSQNERTRKHNKASFIRFVKWGVSVAAGLALVIGVGLEIMEGLTEPEPLYSGCYIVRDGKKITGDNEIGGVIDATFEEGSCLEDEIDFRMAMLKLNNEDYVE